MVSPALAYYRNQNNPENPEQLKIHTLVIEHQDMVKKIAMRIKPRLPYSVSLDDLISAGLYGLIDAANKFDEKHHTSFKTYADWRIRGSIMDELRGFDPLTRTSRKRVQEIEKARKKLSQELGRQPSDEEVAEELGWEKDEIAKLTQKAEEVNFVEYTVLPISNKNDTAVGRNSREDEPFYDLWFSQLKDILKDNLKKLPEQQRNVLALYYQEEMNYKEIALILGVTDSRISQIHSQAIKSLSRWMQTEKDNRGI